ncbi:hypothetical protein P8452_67186 [Trifolium repens]|nr:hypothetical protein P8452_67186 [Trifolium repens]
MHTTQLRIKIAVYQKKNRREKWMKEVKVGFLDKKRVLQRKLNRIGGTADTVFKSGLNRLLKDGVKYRKESDRKVNSIDNEYFVVTLLVLVDGKYLIPSLKRNSKRVDKGDVKTALETILSIPRRNLEGVEVLWTPQMENDVVSKQDVRRDFGFLMRPVDLT